MMVCDKENFGISLEINLGFRVKLFRFDIWRKKFFMNQIYEQERV